MSVIQRNTPPGSYHHAPFSKMLWRMSGNNRRALEHFKVDDSSSKIATPVAATNVERWLHAHVMLPRSSDWSQQPALDQAPLDSLKYWQRR